MAAVPRLQYHDPRSHGLSDPKAYTAWDLEAIRSSNIVFAYLEASNPSGYGLSLEVGYAAALGRHVILVDERSRTDQALGRYFEIVRHTADVVFDELEEGIEYLRSLPTPAES
jgi:hypothetical protein